MCVTLGKAHLSKTTLFVGQVQTQDHGLVHMCGYQNKVQNLISKRQGIYDSWEQYRGEDYGKKACGNAMILPFPAVPGTMSKKNFLTGMDACPHVLEDMATAVNLLGSKGFSYSRGGGTLDVEIFELDIYTVVLAQNARLIPDVIGDVPEAKRPPLKPSTFTAYDVWYPDWPVAVCCFNNEEAALASPIMPWYKPLRPEFLFAPAIDSHTGDVPNLNAQVEVDHTLVVGIDGAPEGKGQRVNYQDQIPAHIRPYVPNRVIGARVHTWMPNGDFVFRMDQVEKGDFKPMRLLPPGAPRAA